MPLFHKLFIMALSFPIVCLMGIVGINEYQLRTSQTLTLPIQGYDPRDLLSGYYLRYKVKYGIKCPKKSKSKTERSSKPAYICFKPEKSITYSPPENCSLFIKGKCYPFTNEFQSKNINRYYIPEDRAKEIEKLFTSAKKQEVVLSVTKKGHALVKDILINGESIKKLINRL